MNHLTDALAWLADPANLAGPAGIWARTGEHLGYTFVAAAIAALIGIPLGLAVGHTGRARFLVVATTGAARALPAIGVLTLVALIVSIGLTAPLVALVLLAVPSILAGAYSGVEAIEPAVVDAARAVGLSEWQVLTRVEIPLGLPQLIGGIRSAVLQVLATATLAAYVGGGGLGRFLFLGLKTQDYAQMLAAAILVVVLAVVLEVVFEVVEHLVSVPGRPKEGVS